MKNTIQKGLAAIVMFVLVVSCFAAVLQTTNANPTPVAGNPSPKMDWNPAYADRALTIESKSYDRGNAAGDKIPSNAHSADYPGIYFYWNDKQKDNGVLLVDPAVFDLFVDETFTVTAKTSNCYWGHVLSVVDTKAYDAESGLYIYNVFRNCMYADKKGNLIKDDMKNINMIFIDGNYKPATLNIEKVWLDEEGKEMAKPANREATFNKPYVLGSNTIEIKDFSTAVNGKKVTVTENDILGFKAKDKSITVSLKADETQTITFENRKQYANIEIVKIWLDENGEVMATPTDVKAAFTINGEPAKLGNNRVTEGTYTVSELPIDGFTLVSDNNDAKVTVEAGKSEKVTFTNQKDLPPPQKATINIIKDWYINGEQELLNSRISPHSDMEARFNVNDVSYTYGTTIEVDAGQYDIAELAPEGDWSLIKVFVNDKPLVDGEIDVRAIEVRDAYGVLLKYTITLDVDAGETYTILFVNDKFVPSGEEYYMNFISGRDFGYKVMDPWLDNTEYGNFNYDGGINDYWNTWAKANGFNSLDDMLAIAAKTDDELCWVWNIENGITICPETQEGGSNDVVEWMCSFDIYGTKIVSASSLYFQADNAVSIYINGKLVDYTSVAVTDPDLYEYTFIDDPSSIHEFRIYECSKLLDFLELGKNEIKIVAANEHYSLMQYNPCGVLLAFEVYSSD